MKKLEWFQRQFSFRSSVGMLPFHLDRLSGTVPRLEAKVTGVSEDILSEKLEGKWSVKQNIGHLLELDRIGLKRIDEILNGVSPMSPAVFEPQRDYNSMRVNEVIGLLREEREKNISRYQMLTEEELQRESLHPRLKVMMNVVDLALFHAEHDDHHLVRISEILEQLETKT